KDKKKFEKVYGAYKDMSDPGGPMQQETRKLREEKAATNDPAAKAKLETKIQTIEKYYGDRYDKLRHRMMNYSRVRTLDFSNRFLERMDNLKIQGYVKQIVNRIDYTNAHVDARVLREINRDQGFIKLVKEGNFQLIADSLNEAAQAARAGADIPKSNPLGAVLKEKIAKWAEGDNTVGFLDHVDSLAGNYRQFVGNPDGPTRGGGFTAAKNAVAAMLRIEVVKEVAGRLKKYADSEGSDEQSYRRNIDAFVKKLDMYKNSKNFEPFFKMTFGTPPVRCDDPDRGFIAVIRRKRDGTEPKQGDPDDPNSDDEAGRLAEQIKFLQSYNGPNSNYPGCPPKDEKEAYKDMSNTDIGIVRQMATISYDIDVANEKSDHQDYANEEVRKMMEKYYLPIKKLEAFKGSSGGDKEK
ncbi:MAG: hypothetical protein LBQ05_00260, partial [Christensenellaceae bacterium]|nr:hypothetical protein [Christensenellaceae bacterium]